MGGPVIFVLKGPRFSHGAPHRPSGLGWIGLDWTFWGLNSNVDVHVSMVTSPIFHIFHGFPLKVLLNQSSASASVQTKDDFFNFWLSAVAVAVGKIWHQLHMCTTLHSTTYRHLVVWTVYAFRIHLRTEVISQTLCGQRYFYNDVKKKSEFLKISGYMWTGPSLLE